MRFRAMGKRNVQATPELDGPSEYLQYVARATLAPGTHANCTAELKLRGGPGREFKTASAAPLLLRARSGFGRRQELSKFPKPSQRGP